MSKAHSVPNYVILDAHTRCVTVLSLRSLVVSASGWYVSHSYAVLRAAESELPQAAGLEMSYLLALFGAKSACSENIS